ncbi:MAG: pyridoxamine 5'-phosphate oxidase family protein [Oscillospiraceae bacterium]
MLKDPEKTIGDLIAKQSISYISSVDEQGFPNTKALLKPRKCEGLKTIYFSTNTSSMRVGQFRKNPKACLYFGDKRFFRGVMLRGTIEVLEDAAHKELLWKSGDVLYYPLGVTDPDYCVLKFTAIDGRYYSNFKSQNFVLE